MQVVAALGRVGGRLDVEKVSGFSFQVVRTVSGTSSNRLDLAIVDRQVVEPVGQVLDRRRVVDSSTGGTWSAAACRSLLVLVWLRSGTP